MSDQTTTHKIFDPQSRKWRNVRDVRHATYDDDGTYGTSEFVEFTVVGNNHDWPLVMPRAMFEEYNPEIEIAIARKE